MKLKNIICLLIMVIVGCTNMKAQDTLKRQDTLKSPPIKPKEKFDLKEHLYVGGNIGLQFGTITIIDVSPMVGYKITEKFSAGLGVTYTNLNDKSFIPGYQINIYGGRIFARYFLLENIFAHTECEVLNGQWNPTSDQRINVASVMGGGGYRQQIGESSYFTILVLYNFNDSFYSPYSNPIIRAGFVIGM